MINIQNVKYKNVTPPVAALNNASALTATVDTLGFDTCTFLIQLGAMNIATTALKVQESDLSNMSGAADVTGAVFGTSTNIAGTTSALPDSTAGNNLYVIDIDCRARKRYLDAVITAGVGSTFVTAIAILSRAEISPTTATLKGVGDALSA